LILLLVSDSFSQGILMNYGYPEIEFSEKLLFHENTTALGHNVENYGS